MTIIVPVTADLRATLSAAKEQIDWLDTHAYNDADHFETTAQALAALAHAIMTATTATSFLAPRQQVASFEFGAGYQVMKLTTDAIGYLTETATELIAGKRLDKYDRNCTDLARGKLALLYKTLLDSVMVRAQEDLRVSATDNLGGLLTAADQLAKAAAE